MISRMGSTLNRGIGVLRAAMCFLVLAGPIRPAFADVYAEFGVALNPPRLHEGPGAKRADPSDIKIVEAGYDEDWGRFQKRVGVGGWSDSTDIDSARGSLYGSAMLGLEVKNTGLVVGYYVGPALISTPDRYLGSNFQIAQEVCLGLMDERGVWVGVAYKHFSNAGLVLPNKGRDFVVMKVKF